MKLGHVYGIPPDLWREVRVMAAETDRTILELVIAALKAYLKK